MEKPQTEVEKPSQEDLEDRLDSKMTPIERGTPYSMQEAEMAFDPIRSSGHLDSYYHSLAQFLIRRIKRLEKEKTDRNERS